VGDGAWPRRSRAMPLSPMARNAAASRSDDAHFRQSALRSFMTTSAFSPGSSRSSGTIVRERGLIDLPGRSAEWTAAQRWASREGARSTSGRTRGIVGNPPSAAFCPGHGRGRGARREPADRAGIGAAERHSPQGMRTDSLRVPNSASHCRSTDATVGRGNPERKIGESEKALCCPLARPIR
jgi:hypothetical protein